MSLSGVSIDLIPKKSSYPTKIRFLSLIDTCIHYLINHPEISVSSLPIELQEHMKKRELDGMYRVLPEYSHEKYMIFQSPTLEYFNRISMTDGKANKINIVIEMLKFIDGHLDTLRYVSSNADAFRCKLIDLSRDGFPIEVSRHYLLKWFNYKLESPSHPPQPRS